MYALIRAFRSSNITSHLSSLRHTDVVASGMRAHSLLGDPLVQQLHFERFKDHPSIDEFYEATDAVTKRHILSGLNFLLDHIQSMHALVLKTYDRDTRFKAIDGWNLLCDSSSLKNTTGYYGQIWINHDKKQVAIVSAGTKLNFLAFHDSKPANLYGVFHLVKDLLNDFQVYAESVPFQYKRGVECFVELFMREAPKLELDLSGYDLTFTGHSLGAILSDLGALYCQRHKSKFKSIHSVTTENPGSKPAMESLYKHLSKKGDVACDSLDKIRDSFLVLNNTPNWVNTACEQFGHVYLNQSMLAKATSPVHTGIPKYLSEMVDTALDHIECHDKSCFVDIRRVTYQPEWRVGLFNHFVHEKWSCLKESIKSNIPGYAIIASFFSTASKIIDKTTEYASSAYSSASIYVEDAKIAYFGDSIDEDDPALAFFITPYDFDAKT